MFPNKNPACLLAILSINNQLTLLVCSWYPVGHSYHYDYHNRTIITLTSARAFHLDTRFQIRSQVVRDSRAARHLFRGHSDAPPIFRDAGTTSDDLDRGLGRIRLLRFSIPKIPKGESVECRGSRLIALRVDSNRGTVANVSWVTIGQPESHPRELYSVLVCLRIPFSRPVSRIHLVGPDASACRRGADALSSIPARYPERSRRVQLSPLSFPVPRGAVRQLFIWRGAARAAPPSLRRSASIFVKPFCSPVFFAQNRSRIVTANSEQRSVHNVYPD